MARARSATRAGPTFCMTWAVMVFLENARPSASVIGALLGAPPSVGRHTWLPPSGISTASSISSSDGSAPCMKAAPYTKGLKVEPGWRRAACTWSNGSAAKSRLPTQASTWPVTGSMAMKPACTRVFSCFSAVMKRVSASRDFSTSSAGSPLPTASRYCGVSRTSACTSSLLGFQPLRADQALSAMPCNWRPCRATAWLAMACRRESMVVRTMSPSACRL